MKLKLISVAVVGAFAATPALALLPGAQNANTTVLRISGATAQNPQLRNLMRRICADNSLDEYRRTSNNSLYFCNPRAGVFSPALPGNLLVYKDGDGGSGNGVLPVADANANATPVPVTFMDIGTLNTSAQCGASSAQPAVTVSGDTLGLPAFTQWSCAAHVETLAVPDAGLSDVEPALFGATVAQQGRLTVTATLGQMFGVPVTTALRDALQTKQIAAGTLPAGCAAGNESLECMPSLSKSTITGLYTGSIATWSSIGLNPADDNVYVVRRVPTSGTQTFARVYFLNDPCTPGASGFVDSGAAAATGDPTALCTNGTAGSGQTVFNLNGSGDVVSCLGSHNAAGRFAIGVLGLEFVDPSLRFVKVGMAPPTVASAANNKYDYVAESTMQRRSGTVNGIPALAGARKQVYDAIAARFQDPGVLKPINAGFGSPFCTTAGPTQPAPGVGCSALLATALNGTFFPDAPPLTDAKVINNPVMTATHSASGSPKNCQPLQPVFPYDADN